MAENRGMSLGVIVLCLIALGVVLFYSINQLSSETPNQTRPKGGLSAASLHAAAEKGDVAAIESEIARGAPVDQLSEDMGARHGMTPLMAAASAGKADAVRALVKGGAQVNARSPDGRTALIFAAGWGDADTVRALLDANARFNDRTEDRWTAVMMAAGRGKAESLKVLLDAGADVASKNKWGQTPLMAAARSGDEAKVRALLMTGPSVNDADNDGMTSLNFAAGADDSIPAIQALIEAKADVNTADSDGVTPLMRAADKGDSEKALVLLNAGAKADVTDKHGRTAADWAKARADELGNAVAKLLEEAAK